MKLLSRALTIAIVLFVVAFFASIASIIFSEQIRANESSLAYRLVSAGCYLDRFAIPILIGVFVSLFTEVILKFRGERAKLSQETGLRRWKQALFSAAELTPTQYFIATLSRIGLVMFFVSQLSYSLNRCQ